MAKDSYGKVLAADLVHHPDDDRFVRYEPTLAQLRWLHASTPVRQTANGYLLAFHEMGLPVTEEALANMIDAAERKHAELAELAELAAQPSIHREMPASGRHGAVVYYARFEEYVKIGTSTDIIRRIGAFPCQGVMAVEWGDRTLEAERHRQFVDQHHHREWFRLDQVLGEHIAGVRERFEPTVGCITEAWLETVR